MTVRLAAATKTASKSETTPKKEKKTNSDTTEADKKPASLCKHCQKPGHKSDDCRSLEKHSEKHPNYYNKYKKTENKKINFSEEQVHVLLKGLLKKPHLFP
jgi:hypothetical protein